MKVRSLFGSIAVLSCAVAVSACNGNASTASPAAAQNVEVAQAAETSETTATTPSAADHGPGHWMFKRVQALDLRPAQADAIAEIQENLHADLAPHRATLRQIAQGLAGSIEAGHIEAADVAAHQAALSAVAIDAKAAFATAMNSVHDTLDASQRATLVERLRVEHEAHERGTDPQSSGPLAKLAFELGLTDEQRASLHDAVQQGADDLFPDRKTRREEQEARMKAMAEAFVSDDFDAASFDTVGCGEHAIEAFSQVATRSIEISEKVLSLSQRQAVAAMIRSHAAKI